MSPVKFLNRFDSTSQRFGFAITLKSYDIWLSVTICRLEYSAITPGNFLRILIVTAFVLLMSNMNS
jgi:hypothetical protein